MIYPEVSTKELIAKLDSNEFYKDYGNPVKCRIFDTDMILVSFNLYERLFGKLDLEKENTIEVDDLIRALVLQQLNEHPVSVTDTEDGYSISMETEIYEYIDRFSMKCYGVTLEKLTSKFIEWIVACPEEFASWVEQNEERI